MQISCQRALRPCVHRLAQHAEVLAPILALRHGLPLEMGLQQRLAVVFIQARVLTAVERLAQALRDAGERFRMAPQRAAQDAVECRAAFRKIFPQPARLPPAEFREPVVVLRPERRLRVAHQHQFRHKPGLYGTIAA